MTSNRTPPGGLRVDVGWTSDGRRLLAVAGELDRVTISRLADALDTTEADPTSVVLDLTGCSFIDSSGLRELILADRRLRATGARLELVVSTPVSRLLALTGLDTLFVVHEPGTIERRSSMDGRGVPAACSTQD